MATRYSVVSGPSKWELMLALFDAKHHPMLIFEVTSQGQPQPRPIQIEVSIDHVGREDGSGESWLINGWSRTSGSHFKGWFRTDSRKGWLELG